MKTRRTLTSPPFCMWCLHAPGSENTQQEATLPAPKATQEISTSKQWHHTPGEWIQLFSYSYTFLSFLRNSRDKSPLPAKKIHLKEYRVTAALHKMTHLSPCPSFICAHISQQQPLNTSCPESACVDERKNKKKGDSDFPFALKPVLEHIGRVCLRLFSWKLWWLYNLNYSHIAPRKCDLHAQVPLRCLTIPSPST